MRGLVPAILAAGLCAPAAQAAPACDAAGAESLFHCAFADGNQVTVCLTPDGTYTYQYGRPDEAPGVALEREQDDVAYTPWNGIERYYWAALGFDDEGRRQEVAFAVDRFDEDHALEGTLMIYDLPDETPKITKTCLPGTVEQALDGLEDRF